MTGTTVRKMDDASLAEGAFVRALAIGPVAEAIYGHLSRPQLMRLGAACVELREWVDNFLAHENEHGVRRADVSAGCHVAVLRKLAALPGRTVFLSPGEYCIDGDRNELGQWQPLSGFGAAAAARDHANRNAVAGVWRRGYGPLEIAKGVRLVGRAEQVVFMGAEAAFLVHAVGIQLVGLDLPGLTVGRTGQCGLHGCTVGGHVDRASLDSEALALQVRSTVDVRGALTLENCVVTLSVSVLLANHGSKVVAARCEFGCTLYVEGAQELETVVQTATIPAAMAEQGGGGGWYGDEDADKDAYSADEDANSSASSEEPQFNDLEAEAEAEAALEPTPGEALGASGAQQQQQQLCPECRETPECHRRTDCPDCDDLSGGRHLQLLVHREEAGEMELADCVVHDAPGRMAGTQGALLLILTSSVIPAVDPKVIVAVGVLGRLRATRLKIVDSEGLGLAVAGTGVEPATAELTDCVIEGAGGRSTQGSLL